MEVIIMWIMITVSIAYICAVAYSIYFTATSTVCKPCRIPPPSPKNTFIKTPKNMELREKADYEKASALALSIKDNKHYIVEMKKVKEQTYIGASVVIVVPLYDGKPLASVFQSSDKTLINSVVDVIISNLEEKIKQLENQIKAL